MCLIILFAILNQQETKNRENDMGNRTVVLIQCFILPFHGFCRVKIFFAKLIQIQWVGMKPKVWKRKEGKCALSLRVGKLSQHEAHGCSGGYLT